MTEEDLIKSIQSDYTTLDAILNVVGIDSLCKAISRLSAETQILRAENLYLKAELERFRMTKGSP